jgi:hypothetical protein
MEAENNFDSSMWCQCSSARDLMTASKGGEALMHFATHQFLRSATREEGHLRSRGNPIVQLTAIVLVGSFGFSEAGLRKLSAVE